MSTRLANTAWTSADPRGWIVLLHGGGQTRHSWRRTAERLHARGWSVVAPDLRGHGDSDWAADGHYGTDVLVDDLRTFVDRSVPARPVLVGASLGGMTALIAEGEQPGLCRALVLVDIVPSVARAGADRIRSFMRQAPDGFASLEDVADAIASYTGRPRRGRDLDGVRRTVRLRDDGRWHWHWDPRIVDAVDPVARQPRAIAAAARVQVPALLVRGAVSDVVTEQGVADLLAVMPRARAVDVAGTGHMTVGDDNAAFVGHLEAFLGEL